MASFTKLEKMVDGMNLKEVPLHHVCEACIEGKQQRTSFPKDEVTKASKLLELVHSDVCGPMKTTSHGGARYFVTFINDFSRKIHVYLLKAKGEVFDKFKAYKALVENQTGMKIKTLRSDNGGKFVSKKFDNLLDECGIQRQTSAPYTPQQNGVAERANRTIMECARSMIRAQGLDLEFRAEAVNTAVYIKSRCPTKALESKTPQETWTCKKPDVSHLKFFGCKTFTHIPDEKRSKLESKSMPCVFLGYCEGTKAYHLMCVETKRIIKSRDVVFLEGTKEVDGVHDNRLPSKEGKYVVVDEVVNDDEIVKDANLISLKGRPTEGVEGDESTSNSSSEKDFATTQNEGLNEPQQDGRR
jgi:transposase InsO family protein